MPYRGIDEWEAQWSTQIDWPLAQVQNTSESFTDCGDRKSTIKYLHTLITIHRLCSRLHDMSCWIYCGKWHRENRSLSNIMRPISWSQSWLLTLMTHDTAFESSTGPKCTTAATSNRRWVVRKMAREDKPRTRFHDCHFMLQGATKRRKITVSHLVSSLDFYLILACKLACDVDGVLNANSPISTIFSTDLKCLHVQQWRALQCYLLQSFP